MTNDAPSQETSFQAPLIALRITRRLLRVIALLLVVNSLCFVCFDILPAPEFRLGGWLAADQQALARYRESLGLHGSLSERYLKHLTNMLEGDLGRTLDGSEVTVLLRQRLQASFPHLLLGIVILVMVPLPLSVLYLNFPEPKGLTWVAKIFHFGWLPPFLAAIVGSVILSWLVTKTSGALPEATRTVFIGICGALLPASMLFSAGVGTARDLRHKPFVLTYYAMGLSPNRVRHLLGVNLLSGVQPILGRVLLGLILGILFSEVAFDEAGFGRMFAEAMRLGDVAVMSAWLTVTATLVLAVGTGHRNP